MNGVLDAVAVVLLASLALGLVRIWRGPGLADRMLAAQLFGTTGVALLLVLAQAQQRSALRDVALVLALLAVLAVLAFVARAWRGEGAGPPEREDDDDPP